MWGVLKCDSSKKNQMIKQVEIKEFLLVFSTIEIMSKKKKKKKIVKNKKK